MIFIDLVLRNIYFHNNVFVFTYKFIYFFKCQDWNSSLYNLNKQTHLWGNPIIWVEVMFFRETVISGRLQLSLSWLTILTYNGYNAEGWELLWSYSTPIDYYKFSWRKGLLAGLPQPFRIDVLFIEILEELNILLKISNYFNSLIQFLCCFSVYFMNGWRYIRIVSIHSWC